MVDALNRAIGEGLKSQSVRDTLAKVGAVGSPPQDFGRFIAAETQKWAAIAKTAGIAPE